MQKQASPRLGTVACYLFYTVSALGVLEMKSICQEGYALIQQFVLAIANVNQNIGLTLKLKGD